MFVVIIDDSDSFINWLGNTHIFCQNSLFPKKPIDSHNNMLGGVNIAPREVKTKVVISYKQSMQII